MDIWNTLARNVSMASGWDYRRGCEKLCNWEIFLRLTEWLDKKLRMTMFTLKWWVHTSLYPTSCASASGHGTTQKWFLFWQRGSGQLVTSWLTWTFRLSPCSTLCISMPLTVGPSREAPSTSAHGPSSYESVYTIRSRSHSWSESCLSTPSS